MKTIWKYRLETLDTQTILMPKSAQVLDVQIQNSILQLWALVIPTALDEERTFRIYGTGHGMPDEPGRYIASYKLERGALVFHVFETALAD